jgi:arylsulfatase A-like enzyme
VHYVEPHAPYRLQEEFAARLGVPASEAASRSDRYDTEIAFVDREVGRLLAALDRVEPGDNNLVLFTSDHGESLGEHGYWGHGRNAFDPNLRIPLGLAWPGKVPAGLTISEPALITDLAPTVLGLLGLPAPAALTGYDWSAVISERAPVSGERVTSFQAHKGAVLGHGEGGNARAGGLLEVAVLKQGRKEILRLSGARRLFDLRNDPRESKNLAAGDARPSPALADWLSRVQQGLKSLGNLPAAELDPESIERLKALGYID